MDLTRTIGDLCREKERLERVIASMEELRATMSIPAKGRRGRKSVSLEERLEFSARMKRYWEDRRNQRSAWS
jgi:hypothetical protein